MKKMIISDGKPRLERVDIMNHFIFLTTEGFTFQPGSETIDPDIDNCQVIGFGSGACARDSFNDMIKNNPWLEETNFDEIYCYKMAPDYQEGKEFFSLMENKKIFNI